ncbi:MAG: GNAT family N-acetyltransferase [Bacteroidia bacterium]
MLKTYKQYELSDERSRIDGEFVHHELSKSYWAEAIPRELTDKSIANSLCFGVYSNGKQVAFARVVSDFATFGYLCDVIVTEEHRGAGIGKWLMEVIMAHPELQNLRRFTLATRDAHTLYTRFGFEPLKNPDRLLEIVRPGIYKEMQEKQGNM